MRRDCSQCDLVSQRDFKWILQACFTVAVAFVMACCGIFPTKLAVNDERVQPLMEAASLFNRTAYGFSALPASGYVRLETKSRDGYDAMLHLDGKTSRTIAFRRDGDRYVWIGEQEIFQGPKEYKTVDGTLKEEICLTYEIANLSGSPLNRLNVVYSGEDTRLVGRSALSLDDIRPILKEWGF